MDYERFNKARLTVQVCNFPIKPNSVENPSGVAKQRTSLVFLTNSFQKKHSQQNQAHHNMSKIGQMLSNQRNSQGQYKSRDRFSSNLLNFPEIRLKTTREDQTKQKMETLKTYNSAKLSVRPYHKIEALLANKYNSRMEIFNKKQSLGSKKTIIISEMNGAQLEKLKQQRRTYREEVKPKVKSMQKVTKNHLNRIKNQIDIPLELLSQRCQETQVDSKVYSLQMKNMLRFEFDNNMQAIKQKERFAKRKKQEVRLEGWKFEPKHSIPSFHLQY